MMNDPVQTIEIYDFNERRISLPAGFDLRVEGRFAKLANKLWNYLIKKGVLVQSFRDDVRIERVRVDRRQLVDNLYEQYGNLLEANRDPEMVIVGRDTFRKMMGMRELHDYCGGPLQFEGIREQWHRSDEYSRPTKRCFNLPVRVVSNMEGVVVLDRGR